MPTPDGKIKVMMLAPSMRTGGAERVLSLLLKHLDRESFSPEMAIVWDMDIAYEIPEGVQVSILEREPQVAEPRVAIDLPPDLMQQYGDSVAWLSGVADKLAAVVERQGPDVIVSSPLWASILATVAHDSLPASTRLINRVDAPPSVSLASSDSQELFAHVMREGFNKADRVVAVSRAVGRDLVENFGVEESRIQVVNNPVDVSRIRELAVEPVDEPEFADDVPVILFVGRLERVKGLEYLLRATAEVLETTPMRCVLVGDGSHRGYLTALAKHLGISEHVHFLGMQSNPFKYLRRATAFVLPSISEGMPNVLLEAMTCGCPVIASDIRGGITREVLEEGKYGLIFPLRDVSALATALQRMLCDDELREGFAQGGLIRAEEFDLPGIIRLNQELISAVAQMEPPVNPEHPRTGGTAETAGSAAAVKAERRQGVVARKLTTGWTLLQSHGWRALAEQTAASFRRPVGVEEVARASLLRAVEPAEAHPWLADGEPTVVCVAGDSSGEAGLANLPRALVLAREDVSARCLIIGDGTWRKSIEPLTVELGLSDAVSFLGAQEHPWRFMHRAAALVHPSAEYEDGVPQAIVDAMACECPVVSTISSDAVSRMLGQGERGVLVPLSDPRALADAMLQLTWDDEARNEMRRKAREYVKLVSGSGDASGPES